MLVELLAFRVVSRCLGSSIYTASSVIGVILGGLAVGGYLGGLAADRFRPTMVLSRLFVLSSVCCLFIPILNNWLSDWSFLWFCTWPQRVALHTLLTFLWPSVCLGAITPVVAKYAVENSARVGRAVGDVYAWGTAGSIVGTFLAGFYLIAALGTDQTAYLAAISLAVAGVVFERRYWLGVMWTATAIVVVTLAVGPWPSMRARIAEIGLREPERSDVFFDRDSLYSHVRVIQDPNEPNARQLILDKLTHSRFDPQRPNELLYGYERIYAALTHYFAGERKDIRVLILGGGGFTHPRDILRRYPQASVTVVEIDPVVTEAAREAFGLQADTRMNIVHLDGRQYVSDLLRRKHNGQKIQPFDFVYLDALNDYNIPFHLTTVEFNAMVKELMAPDGVMLSNVIDVLNMGRFLGAMVQTAKQTFAHTSCFFAADMGTQLDPSARETFVVVATDRPFDATKLADGPYMDGVKKLALSQKQLDAVISKNAMALTDDYAPVEQLLEGVVRKMGGEPEERFYDRANVALRENRSSDAIADYQRAIQIDPMYYFAYLNLGIAHFQNGQMEEAITASEKAAALRPQSAQPYFNMGNVYMGAKDYEAAARAFARCVQLDPKHDRAFNALGKALANTGRLEEATRALEQAVALAPREQEYGENLAKVKAAEALKRQNAEMPK